jgi:hypothetical protein
MPLTEEQYAQAVREHEAACGAAIIAWAKFEVTLLTRFAENYVADESVLRCFRIFMKRMSKLAKKRNMIAHSSSGIIAENGKAGFLQFDFGEEDGVFMFYKKIEFDRENVKNGATDINNLMENMMLYLPTFSNAICASSRMHRELQNDHIHNNDHHQSESKL